LRFPVPSLRAKRSNPVRLFTLSLSLSLSVRRSVGWFGCHGFSLLYGWLMIMFM
jgi:hypothetical protein